MHSQKIVFFVIFRIIKYAMGFVFFLVTVEFFSPTIIGNVRFALSIAAIFSFILNLGFDIAHLKAYPEEKNKSACIGTYYFIKFISIIVYLLFFAILLFISNFDINLFPVFIIFIFDILIQSINTSIGNTFIADNKIMLEAYPWIIDSFFKIIFLFIWNFIFQLNETILASVYIISTIIHTCFLLIHLRNYKIKRPTKLLLKKYFNFTLPLILSSITFIITQNLVVILTKIMISSEAVAYYYAGNNLSLYRHILPQVIILTIVPILSKKLTNSQMENNQKDINLINKYACMIYGVILLISLSYSFELILILVGEQYISSIFIFNALILAEIFVLNDTAVYSDLNARGLTRLYSMIQILGEIYYLPLFIFFIAPFGLNFGINGLALSLILKNLTYIPLVRIYLWKKYHYSYYFGILKYLFAALIVFLINYGITYNIDLIAKSYLIVVFAFLEIGLYLLILYIIKGITKEDLSYFKLLLNIKNLKNLFK